MVIDIQSQRQAAGDKGAGKEVQMREEEFALVYPGQWQQSTVVIDDLKQGQLLVALRKPTMGRGIILPELADLLDLPAANRLSLLLVLGVGSKTLSQGPSADRGAVDFKMVTTMNFGSRKAVRDRRSGAEQFTQQCEHFDWPSWTMVAARMTWLPRSL